MNILTTSSLLKPFSIKLLILDLISSEPKTSSICLMVLACEPSIIDLIIAFILSVPFVAKNSIAATFCFTVDVGLTILSSLSVNALTLRGGILTFFNAARNFLIATSISFGFSLSNSFLTPINSCKRDTSVSIFLLFFII